MSQGSEKNRNWPAVALFEEIVRSPHSRDDKLLTVCRLLKESIAHYDWVGFYIAEHGNRELVLGPFVGAATEHMRIPFGRGICGQVAESEETLVIQDVGAQENYLACSLAVQSEIVVPIFKNGKFRAELDIDSHRKAAFGDEDRILLEKICELVSAVF